MELFGVGLPEAGLVFVLPLIRIGPHRFPESARQAGRGARPARTVKARASAERRRPGPGPPARPGRQFELMNAVFRPQDFVLFGSGGEGIDTGRVTGMSRGFLHQELQGCVGEAGPRQARLDGSRARSDHEAVFIVGNGIARHDGVICQRIGASPQREREKDPAQGQEQD